MSKRTLVPIGAGRAHNLQALNSSSLPDTQALAQAIANNGGQLIFQSATYNRIRSSYGLSRAQVRSAVNALVEQRLASAELIDGRVLHVRLLARGSEAA